jgi:pre-mRNA-splicing factor ATP-dependent RNA helicase DHX15/PRP43
MASKRAYGEDEYQSKRQKMNGSSSDPAANPYLAHHYEQDDGYSNGYGNGKSGSNDALSRISRHQSTDVQARAAEDGPANPFTGRQLSKQYFGILEKRRGLPVHAQR